MSDFKFECNWHKKNASLRYFLSLPQYFITIITNFLTDLYFGDILHIQYSILWRVPPLSMSPGSKHVNAYILYIFDYIFNAAAWEVTDKKLFIVKPKVTSSEIMLLHESLVLGTLFSGLGQCWQTSNSPVRTAQY